MLDILVEFYHDNQDFRFLFIKDFLGKYYKEF